MSYTDLKLKKGLNKIPIWELEDYKIKLKELPKDCILNIMYPMDDLGELWLEPYVSSIKKFDNRYFTFEVCIYMHSSKDIVEFVLEDRKKHTGDIESYKIYEDTCKIVIKIDNNTYVNELEGICTNIRDSIISDISCRENNKLGRKIKIDIEKKLPVYKRALNKVKMEIENFKEETDENKSKVIDILGRVKEISSIEEKVYRKNISWYEVFDRFDDIAGSRVVCEYLEDVYEILDYITSHPELKILKVEDKIKEPLKSGYRGIHIILTANVFYKNILYKDIKVEVQIRTSFQNTWSMKTHKLTYKNEGNIPQTMLETMKELSDILSNADEKVQVIKNEINKL